MILNIILALFLSFPISVSSFSGIFPSPISAPFFSGIEMSYPEMSKTLSAEAIFPSARDSRPVGQGTGTEDEGFLPIYKEPEPVPVRDLFSSSLKMVMSLSFVLVVILLGYYFVRRYVLKGTLLESRGKLIRIIDTLYLGPKKSLYLVDVAGEAMVIGLSNGNLSLLSKLEGSLSAKALRERNTQASSFSEQLRHLFSAPKQASAKPEEESLQNLVSSIQSEIHKLKKI